jgi:uncharacterized protein (TIGR01777 family)
LESNKEQDRILQELPFMRTIITGGTGLIGRALAKSLTSDGHEVIILSRAPERATNLPDGARAERWDARTADGWGALVDGANAIVNLAGESLAGEGFFPSRWTPERRRRILESRVNAGQAVVQAVQSASQKPDVVIQASAIGYYGPHDEEELTEESPPGDDFLAKVVIDWEAATEPVASMSVRHVPIRTGLLLDKNEGALPRLLLPFRLFAGGPMGNGRQWNSWIHITDLVRAIRFLIENEDARGPFNLTAPNPVTNAQLGRTIGRVMRRPYYMPVPGPALRAAFGEVTTVVLDGQRVLPRKLTGLGFEFKFPQAEDALRNILGVNGARVG